MAICFNNLLVVRQALLSPLLASGGFRGARTSAQLKGAPEKIPAGRMNMLATECSKPMAMNIEMGNLTASGREKKGASSTPRIRGGRKKSRVQLEKRMTKTPR